MREGGLEQGALARGRTSRRAGAQKYLLCRSPTRVENEKAMLARQSNGFQGHGHLRAKTLLRHPHNQKYGCPTTGRMQPRTPHSAPVSGSQAGKRSRPTHRPSRPRNPPTIQPGEYAVRKPEEKTAQAIQKQKNDFMNCRTSG